MSTTSEFSIHGQKRFALWLGMVAVLISPWLLAGQTHPTDAELKKRFNSHRGDLERLARMAEEDQHLIRIASNFTWLDTDASWPRDNVGISPARWNAYRSLFQNLGIDGGISRRVELPTSLFFLISGFGTVPSGSTKGLVYSPRLLSPTRESLDGLNFTDKGIYFEKIAEKWYLFVDNNP